jgi:hypothetical protein
MFKKTTHICLIFLLLISTMGLTITKHYCGSHLINQTVNTIPDNCCKGQCNHCHNESKHIILSDNFENIDTQLNFLSKITKLPDISQYSITMFIGTIHESFSSNLFYIAKTCASSRNVLENNSTILQVFRL